MIIKNNEAYKLLFSTKILLLKTQMHTSFFIQLAEVRVF